MAVTMDRCNCSAAGRARAHRGVGCWLACVAVLTSWSAPAAHAQQTAAEAPVPAAPVQASPTVDDSAESAEDAAYGQAIDEGVAEFGRGNFDEAMALFRKAHKLSPNARTLRGIGMTLFELRSYVDAIGYLQHALDEARRPLDAEQRAHAQDLIERSRVFVATYEVELSPATTTLTVDGHLVELQAGQLLLDPGNHEVVARADGMEPVTRRIKTRAGQRGVMAFEMRPLLTAATAGQSEDAPESGDAGGGRTWTWIAAGATVSFAAAAGVFWLVASNTYDEVQSSCENDGCPTAQSVDRAVDDTNLATMETLTTAALVASVASLAATGVLFYLEAPGHADSASASFRVGVQPTGLSMQGSF